MVLARGHGLCVVPLPVVMMRGLGFCASYISFAFCRRSTTCSGGPVGVWPPPATMITSKPSTLAAGRAGSCGLEFADALGLGKRDAAWPVSPHDLAHAAGDD